MPVAAAEVTMAIQGFQKVKASRMCEASVVSTAHSTQMMFLPTLSTSSPNTGDMGAEMMYTMLQERKIIYWTLPESFGNSEARKKKLHSQKIPLIYNCQKVWGQEMLSIQGNSDRLRALGSEPSKGFLGVLLICHITNSSSNYQNWAPLVLLLNCFYH